MSAQGTTKEYDIWLCGAIGLYVFNLVGWLGYFIWKVVYG